MSVTHRSFELEGQGYLSVREARPDVSSRTVQVAITLSGKDGGRTQFICNDPDILDDIGLAIGMAAMRMRGGMRHEVDE